MLTLREHYIQLIGLLILILVLSYTLPRLSEKISRVATQPVTKTRKVTL
jgi:flagellar biogenesis protein FliO